MPVRYEEKESIRLSIIAFALFMATMLIQTSNSNAGTIIAFVCLASIIVFAFGETRFSIKMNRLSVPLLLFLLLISVVTLIKTTQSSRLPRLILQIVAFILLLNIKKVNKREERFLICVYIVCTTVYALLLLYSFFSQENRTHGDITLFGTSFDPNFIGLPFAFASALELNLLIEKKHRLATFLALLIGYVSSVLIVIVSASRGSALSLIISNVIILALYLTRNNKSIPKRVFVLLLCVVAGYLMITFFHDKFNNAFSRILTIGQAGSDNGRLELWRNGIDIWKNNWLVGGGFYSNYQKFGRAVHNTYIEVLSETGLVGVVLLCPYLFRAIKKSLFFNRYMFGALIALLIQIVFLDALDNRVLWVVFCWIAVLPDRRDVPEQAVV